MELTGYILFIPIIFFIVVFHELGHFLLAKLFKIDVEEFAIGFPPRIFATKIFSTIVSFNFIPLGGYVKLPKIDNPDNGDRFSSKLRIKTEQKESKYHLGKLKHLDHGEGYL